MNNLLQMTFQQKLKQIPQGMMKQMENQLKMRNPQAFKEYQQARKENRNPNEYLNEIVNKFSPEQKEQWNSIMGQFNQK